MIRRAGRLVFILALLALSLLPMAQMAAGLVREEPVAENRRLAPPPDLAQPLALPRTANAWFSDHFGLRSLMIRVKAQLDYDVFGVSDRVHAGQDGFLFYRSVMDVEKPAVERLLAVRRADIAANIARYVAALREAGIDAVVMVNLLGDRFLEDKLPRGVTPRPARPGIDALIEALRNTPGLPFIDTTAILHRVAAERPVFHRTDFHWNDPAAFEVAREVVAALSRAQGMPGNVLKHPLEIERRAFSGGVASFMPLLRPVTEEALFVRQNWAWPPGFRAEANPAPFETVLRSDAPPGSLLRPAMFLGDSFFDGMIRSGLEICFSGSYRFRWKPGMSISGITAAMPADTASVVIQFIEIGMAALLAFGDTEDVTRAIGMLRGRGRAE